MWQDETLKIKGVRGTIACDIVLYLTPVVLPLNMCSTRPLLHSLPVLLWLPCASGSCWLSQTGSCGTGFAVVFLMCRLSPMHSGQQQLGGLTLLNAFTGVAACSLTSVCGSLSLGQCYIQVTDGEMRSRGKNN